MHFNKKVQILMCKYHLYQEYKCCYWNV